MNRAQRRDLQRRVKKMAGKVPARVPGRDFVELKGGPMNGYLVKPDAPALREDWHTTWIDSIRANWAPGRYVQSGRIAKWMPL